MPKSAWQLIEYTTYNLEANFPISHITKEFKDSNECSESRFRFHNCLEIALCHYGEGKFLLQNEVITMTEGDIALIPRFIPHRYTPVPSATSCWSFIHLDLRELLTPLFPQQEDFELDFRTEDVPLSFSKEKAPRLLSLLNSILWEMEQKHSDYHLAVTGLCLSLYCELNRLRLRVEGDVLTEKKLSRNIFLLKPALDYISENYMKKFSVEDLADLCHMSPTHFRRHFWSIMGSAPLHYINNLRIQRACLLLKTTDHPIGDIAKAVGFTSISSFNRAFSMFIGSSPRHYRLPSRHH